MRLIVAALICMLFAGCATTHIDNATPIDPAVARVARIRAKADKLSSLGGRIIKRTGPFIAAGVCVVAPEYCIASKAAYRGAVVAINAIEAEKSADDGLKLAALAEEFQKNIDTINGVMVATGQDKIDLSEFQAITKELQADVGK